MEYFFRYFHFRNFPSDSLLRRQIDRFELTIRLWGRLSNLVFNTSADINSNSPYFSIGNYRRVLCVDLRILSLTSLGDRPSGGFTRDCFSKLHKRLESQNLQNCAGNLSQKMTPTIEPAQPTTEVEPQSEPDKALKHLAKARKLELELGKMKGELELPQVYSILNKSLL